MPAPTAVQVPRLPGRLHAAQRLPSPLQELLQQ
jgi:hypothetical protein